MHLEFANENSKQLILQNVVYLIKQKLNILKSSSTKKSILSTSRAVGLKMIKQLKRCFHQFNSGYYNFLLLFLIILFATRPYERGIIYIALWKLFFTCTFFTAIFNVKHHRNVKLLAMILAIPTLIFTWLELYHSFEWFFIGNVLFTIVFLGVCTTSILFDVILHARVTLETLKGVVCAYFMIAFLFAYIYYFIEFIVPGSFHLIQRDVSFVTYSRNLSEMMYFSFVTLLTIGFGDITPLLNFGQTTVVIEGIIGQFYVAILVSRIVAVYSFPAQKKMLENALKKTSSKQRKSPGPNL
jgi:voltage-gated potassium channel